MPWHHGVKDTRAAWCQWGPGQGHREARTGLLSGFSSHRSSRQGLLGFLPAFSKVVTSTLIGLLVLKSLRIARSLSHASLVSGALPRRGSGTSHGRTDGGRFRETPECFPPDRVISDPSSPREPARPTDTCELTALRRQARLTGSPRTRWMWKDTGYRPRMTEMPVKATTAASPDSYLSPYVEKC